MDSNILRMSMQFANFIPKYIDAMQTLKQFDHLYSLTMVDSWLNQQI